MARLVTIISELQLHGYGSVVPIPEYKTVFPDAEEYDPYYLALRHTIINMAHIGRKEQDAYLLEAGMECWFESGNPAQNAALRKIFDELRSLSVWEESSSLMPIQFGNKSLRQLQAADLIAREAFKHFDNVGVRKTRIPVLRLRNLLNFTIWNTSTLEYLRDNGGPQDLGLLTSWGRDANRPTPPAFAALWRDDLIRDIP